MPTILRVRPGHSVGPFEPGETFDADLYGTNVDALVKAGVAELVTNEDEETPSLFDEVEQGSAEAVAEPAKVGKSRGKPVAEEAQGSAEAGSLEV